MANIRHTADKALQMLRVLPRVSLGNLKPNPGSKQLTKRGRGQHAGDKHGAGNKGSGQRQNHMRLGYETGNSPFYLRFKYEPYYKGHHLRRSYPPLSLLQLQIMIDTNRVNSNDPIDLGSLCRTGVFTCSVENHDFGVQLTDEGLDQFNSKINIEVQHAPENVIAAIEKNGGVVRTAYYDPHSLWALTRPERLFAKGQPIPKRMMPPQDAVPYYTDPTNRGYLANPDEISQHRLVLAQKYGYELPKIEEDPNYEMLMQAKDPRQIFFGLNPGWVISLKDKAIITAKE